MRTCPECGEAIPARTPPVLYCPACGAALAPAPDAAAPAVADAGGDGPAAVDPGAADPAAGPSVRPPDLALVGDEVDPLQGWDTEPAPPHHQPPPSWVLVAGTAGVAALVGLLGSRRRVRGVLLGAVAGAAAAAGVLRVWELAPEDTTWARALSGDG